jgi:L-ascorbate metabolism protein UlaG (beta-lactamase superfamily)
LVEKGERRETEMKRLMPIFGMIVGSVFTMDAEQAAKSLILLRLSIAVPMHFGTFPILAPNADDFVRLAKKTAPKVNVVVLKPGQSYTLKPGAYE